MRRNPGKKSEILKTGKREISENLNFKTPGGNFEMLNIKGIELKKIHEYRRKRGWKMCANF